MHLVGLQKSQNSIDPNLPVEYLHVSLYVREGVKYKYLFRL